MRNFGSIPGAGGITFIAIGSIFVSVLLTIIARSVLHRFALAVAFTARRRRAWNCQR